MININDLSSSIDLPEMSKFDRNITNSLSMYCLSNNITEPKKIESVISTYKSIYSKVESMLN